MRGEKRTYNNDIAVYIPLDVTEAGMMSSRISISWTVATHCTVVG
jgi:hypothetical protein